MTVEQDDRRLLQLWQRRNWHWYLKKERRYEQKQVCPGQPALVDHAHSAGNLMSGLTGCTSAQGALRVHWDEAAPGILRVCTANGLFTQASA